MSLDQILHAKFTDSLTPEFKLHLLTQKAQSFEEIVDALASFQEISQQMVPRATIDHISAGTSSDTKQATNHPEVDSDSSQDSFVTQNQTNTATSHNVHHVQATTEPIVCQWCERRGHSANSCYQLKRLQSKSLHSRNQNRHSRSQKSSRSHNSAVAASRRVPHNTSNKINRPPFFKRQRDNRA